MIDGIVKFDKATPSYQELMPMLANHLKIDEKLIVIRHVYTSFGESNAKVIAYAYKDEKMKEFIEPKVKKKKEKKTKEVK